MRSKSLGLSAILAACACAISACDKIPGTDPYKVKIAKEVAARGLIDPSSAQFRDLEVHGDVVCGELNGKNRMGAYVGFSRFFADTKAKTSSIDPQFDLSDLLSASDFCSSVRSNSYSSYSLVKSACERESEQRLAQLSQTIFDTGWKLHCEGGSAPETNQAAAADALEEDAANLTMNDLEPLSNEIGDLDADGMLVDENGEPVTESEPRPENLRATDRPAEPEDPLQPRNESASR